MICSIAFAGTEVRLTGLSFPGTSFVPFLKAGGPLAFFQSSEAFPELLGLSKGVESTLVVTPTSSLRCMVSGAGITHVSPIGFNIFQT